MKILAKHDMELPLGKQGMNEATVIRFPIEHMTDEFGRGGSFQLLHQRSKDKAPYPCQITEDQFFVYWAVTEQDVEYAGIGKAELQYRREGVVFKSLTWRTRTEAGLGEATEAPELQRGWVDELLDAAAGIEGQSKAAETAATKAEQSENRTAKLEQSTREMVKGAENELDKAKPMVFEVRTRMTEPFVYEITEPTFETLKEKHDAGYHNLWLHSGNYQMPLTHAGSGDREQFKATYTLASETAVRGYEWLFTQQGCPYTNTIMGPELKSNKITSLEEEPAATQYPSAGAVYDALKKKADKEETPFIAEYGKTTFQEIADAAREGQEVVCIYYLTSSKNYRRTYNLDYISDSTNDKNAYFSLYYQSKHYSVKCTGANEWTELDTVTFQTTANRVDTIDEKSTSTQYPSAKGVYDLTKPMADDIGKLTEAVSQTVETNIPQVRWGRGYISETGEQVDSVYYARTYALSEMVADGDKVKVSITGDITTRFLYVAVFSGDGAFKRHIEKYPKNRPADSRQEVVFTATADEQYCLVVGRENAMVITDIPESVSVEITSMNPLKRSEIENLRREVLANTEAIERHEQLMPSEAPTVGKLARVAEVFDDGTFRMEWIDEPSGGVSDVTVNGSSIVTDGVASIPYADTRMANWGLSRFPYNCGITSNQYYSYLQGATKAALSGRQPLAKEGFGAVTSDNLDYAVKAALTDGVGPAYSEAEQKAACERLGAEPKHGQYELIKEVTLAEDADEIWVDTDSQGNPISLESAYVIFQSTTPQDNSVGTLFSYVFPNGSTRTLSYAWRTFKPNTYAFARCYVDNGLWFGEFSIPNTLYQPGQLYGPSSDAFAKPALASDYPVIKRIRVYKNASGGIALSAGSKLTVYGVRK